MAGVVHVRRQLLWHRGRGGLPAPALTVQLQLYVGGHGVVGGDGGAAVHGAVGPGGERVDRHKVRPVLTGEEGEGGGPGELTYQLGFVITPRSLAIISGDLLE